MGRRASDMRHHAPRLSCGRYLATRAATAAMLNRHPDQVSRHAEPVACDVGTRLALYDVDDVEVTVARLRRRVA